MVKSNTDKILDYLRVKKSASIGDISKHTGIPKNDLNKSAEYLEKDGVAQVEHKFPNTIVTLVKDPEMSKPSSPSSPPGPAPSSSFPQNPFNDTSQGPLNSSQQPPAPQPVQTQSPPNTLGAQNQWQQNPQQSPNPFDATSPVQTRAAQQQDPFNVQQPSPQNPPFQQTPQQPPSPNPFTSPQNPPQPVQSAPVNPQGAQQPPNPSSFQNNFPQQSPPSPKPAWPSEPQWQKGPVTQDSSMQNTFPSMYPGESPSPEPQGPPHFAMQPPAPVESNIDQPRIQQFQSSPQTTSHLRYSDDFQNKEYNFPDYTDSPPDKIDYLIDVINNKITNHDYDNLNVLYRKAYNLYESTNDMSPNIRHIMGKKLNELFNRIRRTYLIENIM